MTLRFPREEDNAQARLVAELRARGVRVIHVPNEGRLSKRAAVIRRALGVEAGIPDLLIFTPPPFYPLCTGGALELKIEPNKPTAAQLKWLRDLYACRWAVDLISGPNADEVIKLGCERLRSWGYL